MIRLLLLMVVGMTGKGWAMDMPKDIIPGTTYYGDFIVQGKKHPSLKPKPTTVEWFCIERLPVDKFELGISTKQWLCIREIGFRSDGMTVWRDPRKEKNK